MSRIALDQIRKQLMEMGRSQVRIIAVSKTHGPEQITEFLKYGQRDFGENRQNEARDKLPLVRHDSTMEDSLPIYHHIGPLQSGAARQIPGLFDWVHGAASLSAMESLARAAERWSREESNAASDSKEKRIIRYLIQIRLIDEEGKEGGMTPEEFRNLNHIPENEALAFCGFMTMGPTSQDPNQTREVFSQLRELRDASKPDGELSMGMSGDWQIAVEEGATMIRLGTVLFGQRKGGPWKK